jgi:hypothetical protein
MIKTASDRNLLAPRGERPLNPRTLRRVFLDLLGRPPLDGERATWMGRPMEELVVSLLATEAHWRNWMEEQLYYFLLIDNFRPVAEQLQVLPAALTSGEVGVREALLRICLSSAFDRRNPGPDTFVTVVMEQLLGITVQSSTRELEIGKRVYDGARGNFLGRPASSQADIVNIAMSDSRAMDHFVRREHQRLLRRSPSAGEARRWTALLEERPCAYSDVLGEWLLSDTYEQRLTSSALQPNRVFVRALHVDLFGRTPEEIEVQRLCTALNGLSDSGPLRSLLSKLILDSGKSRSPERSEISDPTAWIRGEFERLLGRAPSTEELAAFCEAFGDSACRPTTVLYAIVSHPEYQTW